MTSRRNKDCITFHLSYSYLMVQEFTSLRMRYASLAFRTLSLLDLMSSSGIIKSVMSVLLALVLARGSWFASSQIQNLEEWNLTQMKRKKTEKKNLKCSSQPHFLLDMDNLSLSYRMQKFVY